MPVASAIFLVLSLTLSVLFGAQTNAWAWGPALLPLMLAMVAAMAALIKQPSRMLHVGMVILGGLTVVWFGMRAIQSPVEELAHADLLLLGTAFAGFVSVLAIQECRKASAVLTGGIAALLVANLLVMVIQLMHPGYAPLIDKLPKPDTITGFFGHYNYAANYLLVSSLWLLGQAWQGKSRLLKVGLGLLGTLGMVAIYWTKSRGGWLAAIVALACFGLLILIEAKRNKAKWFPLAAIGLPFAALILMGLLISGWQEIQAARSDDGSGDVSGILDNTVRLNYLGIAVSTMLGHTLLGGGSQSYSWECFQHWDRTTHSGYYTKPEFVHNEWLQAATDYGLIGFLLVLALMATVAISAILRVCFEPKITSTSERPVLRLAGLAALLGTLAHTNFSFLFHLMPGSLLLGMCLAASCQWHRKDKPEPAVQHGQRGVLAFVTLMVLLVVGPLAWKGTRLMMVMWPSQLSPDREARAAERSRALDEGLDIWPQAKLHLKRAYLRHDLANAAQDEATRRLLMEKAIADYAAAGKLHPYLPEPAINRAILLSRLGRDTEAEEAFANTIRLQGGMETIFRGHYLYAGHLFGLGQRNFAAKDPASALAHLERAAEQIELAHFWDAEGRQLEIDIHESLGLARELNNKPQQALKSYTHAATIHYGSGRRVHLRSALLQAELANRQLLAREPAKALGLFLEAKQSVAKSGGQLPANITPEKRAEFVRMLDEQIRRLKEIGIEAR